MDNPILEIALHLISQYGYAALFIVSFVEGFNIMFIGGFIAALGLISVWQAVLMLFLGDILSDIMWYYVGYFGGEKSISFIGRYYKAIHEQTAKIRLLFERHIGKIIISVKMTSGLCLAMVLTAGFTKLDFKKFLYYDFIGSAGWVLISVGIGYFFGSSYALISQYYKTAGFIVLSFLILAIISMNYLWRKIKLS